METEILKHKKKEYIRRGIKDDISIKTVERETKTPLGSTDKKGYRVEMTATWIDEKAMAVLDISPWQTEQAADIIKSAEMDLRADFAGRLVDKFF